MPPLILRNRPGNGVDNLTLFQYLEARNPVVEYKMNQASGNLINEGSAGSGFDIPPRNSPNPQARAGETFGEVGNFQTFFSGDPSGDAYGDVVPNPSALTDLSEGTVVILFNFTTIDGQDLVYFHNRQPASAGMRIRGQSANGGSIRFIGFDGTSSKEIWCGDINTFTPVDFADGVTHMLVLQYDAARGHQMWIDGVRVDNNGNVTDNNNVGPNGSTFWFDDLVGLGVDVMCVGGNVEIDSGGSFTGVNNEMRGYVEYVGIFPDAFTDEENDQVWKRYIGGPPPAETPVGLDKIAEIIGTGVFNTAPPNYHHFEKCHARWVVRSSSDVDGFCPRILYFDTDFNSAMTYAEIMTGSGGLAATFQESVATANNFPTYVRAPGGARRRSPAGTGPSEAFAYSEGYDYSVEKDGRGLVMVKGLALGSFTSRAPIWMWNDNVANGQWDLRTGWHDIQPGNIATGGGRPQQATWTPDGRFLAIASQSSNGQNPATGGGGIHIYEMTYTPSPLNITGVRQTISGYAPTNEDIRGVWFFNDGTDDYLLVFQTTTAAIGVTGEQGGIGVFKRNSGTGVWEAQSNLINNGVDPIVNFPGNDRINELALVGNSLYIGYWASPAGPVAANGAHLEWNGTYWEYQGKIPWPAFENDVPPIATTISGLEATSDERGVVMIQGGTFPDPAQRPVSLVAYDRDLATGVLTYRADYWGPEWRSGLTDAQIAPTGVFKLTDIPWIEQPNGIAVP